MPLFSSKPRIVLAHNKLIYVKKRTEIKDFCQRFMAEKKIVHIFASSKRGKRLG